MTQTQHAMIVCPHTDPGTNRRCGTKLGHRITQGGSVDIEPASGVTASFDPVTPQPGETQLFTLTCPTCGAPWTSKATSPGR